MLKDLLSMFVEVENKPIPENDTKNIPSTTSPQVSPQINYVTQITTPIIPGAVDEKMSDFLSKAIEDSNIPGFDYIEFRNSLASMANTQLQEQQKYIAVFATASTMGLTKEKLINSIDHYQGILDSKKKEFKDHSEQMIANEVTKREELKAIKEAEIQELLKQIQDAQTSIAAKQQEVLDINTEIGRERLNIQQTNASFEVTYNFISSKLQNDKQKIETYIVI